MSLVFAPGVVRAVERPFRTEASLHTPRMAVPEPWTKQAKCLDDWKAFAPADEVRDPCAEVAEALCAGCPVFETCLATALEEEGTLQPALRAGIRGGLTPVSRYKLSKAPGRPTSARACPSGHPRAEVGYWDGNRWRCNECRRIQESQLVTCSCGKEGQRNTIRAHKMRKGCSDG